MGTGRVLIFIRECVVCCVCFCWRNSLMCLSFSHSPPFSVIDTKYRHINIFFLKVKYLWSWQSMMHSFSLILKWGRRLAWIIQNNAEAVRISYGRGHHSWEKRAGKPLLFPDLWISRWHRYYFSISIMRCLNSLLLCFPCRGERSITYRPQNVNHKQSAQ